MNNIYNFESLNMKSPVLSVLIPTYNRELFISESLASILNQKIDPKLFEVCIYDDGSTDKTMMIISSLMYSMGSVGPRIKILSDRKNKGVGHARNELMNMADGRYFVWMDSDDISIDNRLSTLLANLLKNPDVDVLFSGMRFFNHDISTSGRSELKTVDVSKYVDRDGLFNNINFPTGAFKRELKKYQFREDVARKEDIYWLTRLIGDNIRFKSINDCLYYLRRHPGRLTNVQSSDTDSDIQKSEPNP